MNNNIKAILLLFACGSISTLTACSSAKSTVINNCEPEGFPRPVCDCIYDKLSALYDDNAIKASFKEMDKIESGQTLIPSKEVLAFSEDVLDGLAVCTSNYSGY